MKHFRFINNDWWAIKLFRKGFKVYYSRPTNEYFTKIQLNNMVKKEKIQEGTIFDVYVYKDTIQFITK